MQIDRTSFVPLYAQLKNAIQRRIMAGELTAGSALPSEPALCRIHQVSRITVRRALGELEAEGFISREPGRGTFVTAPASRRGLMLGLVFGGLSQRTFGHRNDAVFGEMVGGAAEAAARRGALLLPMPLGDEDDLETVLGTPPVRQLSGLLVRLARAFDEDTLRMLDSTRLPYVVIKRRLPAGRAGCVFSDDGAGSRAATAHLLEQGHVRIALLLGPDEVGVWEWRRQGYELAHAEAGIRIDPGLVRHVGFPMDEGGYQGALDLLCLPAAPSAFFAGNDHMALGVYRALRRVGREPGRDVAVIGYGGTPFAATMYPALTTVSTSAWSFGRVAADLLLDGIAGSGGGPAQRTVPWRLEVRQSTVWEAATERQGVLTEII